MRPRTIFSSTPGFGRMSPLEDQSLQDLLWIREDFVFSFHDYGKRIVFGHTVFNDPWVDRFKIGIDTGAVYGGALTAVVLPETTFISI